VPIAVEDHDQFGGTADSRDGVWRHGVELCRLALLHEDLSLAEEESYLAFSHEEPVVTGMSPLLRCPICRLVPDLEGDCVCGRPAQHPRRAFARTAYFRADDHIVIVVGVQQCVQADLEGSGERDQDVETDCAVASLNSTDR